MKKINLRWIRTFVITVGVSILLCSAGCSHSHLSRKSPRGLLQSDSATVLKRRGLPARRPANVVIVPSRIVISSQGFSWPLKTGSVSSFYGARDGNYHDGIDIRARAGTPIYAAQQGVVIYSDRGIRGYGNVVILRHERGLSTVYAHNRKNAVRRGDTVRRGSLIAYVGATGRATGPHLHFEVRHLETPHDPLYFLPASSGRALASVRGR